ncbi:fragment of L-lactate permease (part 3) [Candidatus Sulfopaludibacter sp. SbA3]|nr:fragment of L-lactate permease (part 3) [Candidatus Sulfopaludibacter sp. SbA3]
MVAFGRGRGGDRADRLPPSLRLQGPDPSLNDELLGRNCCQQDAYTGGQVLKAWVPFAILSPFVEVPVPMWGQPPRLPASAARLVCSAYTPNAF